jgi:gluconolactonase
MPNTNSIRVVADGIVEPNGLVFSPDEKVLYVTDGAGNSTALQAPRTIYAYDVLDGGFLGNKRVFAMPEVGIPDGIKVDGQGNVWAGCGDGVNVWDASGELLGKIKVDGGSANLVLGKGKVWLLNEEKLWEATVAGLVV